MLDFWEEESYISAHSAWDTREEFWIICIANAYYVINRDIEIEK